ncbi:hypothetical protein JQK87_32625, partial [Streptomyces sp. G44]|nr:hypothetical protein [Streptomyces sp. G44]
MRRLDSGGRGPVRYGPAPLGQGLPVLPELASAAEGRGEGEQQGRGAGGGGDVVALDGEAAAAPVT